MGMITTACLDEGLCFGPLPTDLMIADPAYLIAQTTTDHLSELPTVIANPQKLSDPIRLIEWVCNLRSARNPAEQNVELIRLPATGQSFYHLTRRIEPGEEMFVWFRRSDLNPLLGDLLFSDKRAQEAWNRDVRDSKDETRDCGSLFTCGRCGASFLHIYPYVCHILFKCERRPSVAHSNPGTKSFQNSTIQKSDLPPQAPPHFAMPINLTNNEVTLTKPTPMVHSHSMGNSLMNGDSRAPLTDRPMNCLIPNLFTAPVINTPIAGLNEVERSSLKHLPSPNVHNPTQIAAQIRPENNLASKLFHANLPARSNRLGSSPTNRGRRSMIPLPMTYTHKSPSYATVRTRNPLVEQLLQTLGNDPVSPATTIATSPKNNNNNTTSATTTANFSLSQNWCARCSVSFRLTSDLVQHMRTHHNNDNRKVTAGSKVHDDLNRNRPGSLSVGEAAAAAEDEYASSSSESCSSSSSRHSSFRSVDGDSARERTIHNCVTGMHHLGPKSTADRLLSCHLCGEIFRERHHLTRHMISHS